MQPSDFIHPEDAAALRQMESVPGFAAMTKKVLVLCIALLSAPLLLAKPYTQQGIAYLYDYKTKTKNPVANVSLTVAYAKGPAVSRTDGTFTIEFQDFGAGKKLAFEKQPFSQGLIVLNKKEVDEWSTFEGKLTLIMCNKKDFDACKQNYYDVGLQSVTQRYEWKIAALKKESSDYQQRLQELEEERDRIIDNLRNSADAMARIDQSELDATMQEVLDLYEHGNVDEAMQKLEDMKLGEKFVQTLERKQKLEQAMEKAKEDSIQILNKLRTSVDMYKNNGNWDKAAETLKLLADKLNTFDDLFVYARFCQKQNDLNNAEIYYERALKICQELAKENPKVYEPNVATTLNNLAELYRVTNRFSDSEGMFKEALELYKRLAEINPKAYEPDVALTLSNLGGLYYYTQRFSECENMYKSSLVIYLRLLQLVKDNLQLNNNVASTLNKLALLYDTTGRLSESEALYKQALKAYELLSRNWPEVYEVELARIMSNIAYLYSISSRFSDSEIMYKQALEILHRLVKKNPHAYEPLLATTMHNLASLYQESQRLSDSEKMYEQAIEIRLRLAKKNPQAYEEGLAMTYHNLALIYRDTQRYGKSEQLEIQAVEIYRRLNESNPQIYGTTLSNWLGSLSYTVFILKKYNIVEEYAQEALSFDSTQHWIAQLLAHSLLFQGKSAEAESIYRQYKNELKDSFLDDFKQFKAAGVIPKEREEDVEKIKRMLEE